MSSTYPDLPLPITYVPVCIPPPVQFEDQPVLEEVGKGKTHQSQKSVCLLASTIFWMTSFAKLIFYPVDLVCMTFFLLVNVCKGISLSLFAASKTATQVIANVTGLCINLLARPAVHRCLRAARYQSHNSSRLESRTTRWRSRLSAEDAVDRRGLCTHSQDAPPPAGVRQLGRPAKQRVKRRNLEADEVVDHREHVRAPPSAFFARKFSMGRDLPLSR